MSKTASAFCAGILIGVLVATMGFAAFLRHQNASSGGEGAVVPRVLKLGHGLDTSHPVHVAMESMKTRLEELSSGRLTIDIYSGAVLGSETECIEQLQNGSLAMTKTSAAALENFIPSLAVFSLPYVFRDEPHFWSVLGGEIGDDLLARGEDKYLRGLCYYDAGSRNFYTKSKPIRRPADLKGLKIRVMNSATAIEMVKSMGGAPTPIAWGTELRQHADMHVVRFHFGFRCRGCFVCWWFHDPGDESQRIRPGVQCSRHDNSGDDWFVDSA